MPKKQQLNPAPVAETKEYEVGVWAGSPHYRCKLCQFDTLIGLDTMLTHLVERHSSNAALNALFPSPPGAIEQSSDSDPANEVSEIKEVDNNGTNIPN